MIWPRIPTSTRREGQVLIARDLVRGWFADQLHGQCRTGPADVGAGYRNGSVHKSRALTAVKPGPAIGRDDHLGAGIKIHLCLISVGNGHNGSGDPKACSPEMCVKIW